MKTSYLDTCRVWTVSQAKTHLSEVLRCPEEERPRQIGKRRPFVVIPASQWNAINPARKQMGKWLIDNIPQGVNLNFHYDRKSGREIPFETGESE